MIFAIKDKDRVVIVGIVETNSDMGIEEIKNQENCTIKIKNGTMIGFCVRDYCACKLLCKDDFIQGEVNDMTLLKETIPQIKEVVREYDFADEDDTNVSWDNACYVASGNRLYVITPKLYVREEYDCAYTGCYSEEALGALVATVGLPIEQRIRAVIDTIQISERVKLGPFYVADSKTQQITIWED